MSDSATRLSDQAVDERIRLLTGWQRSGGEISKTYKFNNYYETMAFVNAVAWIAHGSDHHPDLEVGYNKCKVRFSTHSAGGITQKDLESAERVEALLK